MNYVLSTLTKKIKSPIIAGMPTNGIGCNKLKKVGYDVIEISYNVYTYPDGYQDLEITGERRTKRVFFK